MLEDKAGAMYTHLKNEDVAAFNQGRKNGEPIDLKNAKFRAFDLRGAELSGLDLSGSYFKNTDLRGADLRGCNLDGCSLLNAKISGVYFPPELSAEEIKLSLTQGTRLRMKR